MTASVWADGSSAGTYAGTALELAARFWFLVAVAGQAMFVAYVVVFYGGAALRGDLAAWNKVLPDGYDPADVLKTIAIAAHLALAVVVMAGGPLQLIPQVRRRFPRLHRWTGRAYIPAAILTSFAGLFMVWRREGDVMRHIGISVDALLIIAFALLAMRHAIAGDLRTHRRWALRLFMAVNAVWFFRVGLMFWIAVNQGPVGFDTETFTGPFLSFLSFADYLLPLAILELYLRTKETTGVAARYAVAALLVICTLAMGVGIAVATMGLWLPHM